MLIIIDMQCRCTYEIKPEKVMTQVTQVGIKSSHEGEIKSL